MTYKRLPYANIPASAGSVSAGCSTSISGMCALVTPAAGPDEEGLWDRQLLPLGS